MTQNKRVRLQEFGSKGNDAHKAKTMLPLIYAAIEVGLPFMPWQLVHPESTTDYEFWTQGDYWRGLSALSQTAHDNVTVFSWPELNLSSSSMQLKPDWQLCVVNAECASGCCSNEFSDDKKYKCTPGGSQCTGNRLADWVWCTQSSECACGCCSSEYSDDGRYKCTPGGARRLCGVAVAGNDDPCYENGNLAPLGALGVSVGLGRFSAVVDTLRAELIDVCSVQGAFLGRFAFALTCMCPLENEGNCASGCCSSGRCVARAPPFQCDRLQRRPNNWRWRRLRRRLRRHRRRRRLHHANPKYQLEDPMLLLQLSRQQAGFVDASPSWAQVQGKLAPTARRSAGNEC